MRQPLPIVILIFLLSLLAMSPVLLAQGMFMDGLIYSCVAMNLKDGIGDFWHLQFTQTLYAQFHEHPPLAMWLQSQFMKMFGNAFWVDRIFSILTILLQGLLIYQLSKLISAKSKHLSYWPMFFFLFTPLTIWMMPNNLLENTLGIFTLSATIFALLGYQRKKIIWAFASGILITAAIYTKGPVGLFPFSFFVLHYFFQNPRKDFMLHISYFLIQVMGFLISFFVPFLLSENIQLSWKAYWARQVVNSIENVVTVNHRFYVVQQALLHLLPMIGVIAITYFILKRKQHRNFFSKDNQSSFWLFYGLSGIAPMMISLKQREFYILPALPFLIISICILAQPILTLLEEKLNAISIKKIWTTNVITFITIIIISISQYGKLHRNVDIQADLNLIHTEIPNSQIIRIAKQLREDWSLYAYGYRYYHWSFDDSPSRRYYLDEKQRSASHQEASPILMGKRFLLFDSEKLSTPNAAP